MLWGPTWAGCGAPSSLYATCPLSWPRLRAITEMVPISSDCWNPAQALSQLNRRVTHQGAGAHPPWDAARGDEGCSLIC